MQASEAVRKPPLGLFVATYVVHLLDEIALFGGLPGWGMERGFYFTIENWLIANSIAICLLLVAVFLTSRGIWPAWVRVSIATHLSLHAIIHLCASLWGASLSPGALTSVAFLIPLAIWCFRWARSSFSRRTLTIAVLIGAATFQAPWDLLLRLLLGLPVWTA